MGISGCCLTCIDVQAKNDSKCNKYGTDSIIGHCMQNSVHLIQLGLTDPLWELYCFIVIRVSSSVRYLIGF